MWRKKLGWVDGCFQHFLKNFSEIDKNVKEKILDIQKSIGILYQKIETRIDEVVEKMKDFDDPGKVQRFCEENKLDWVQIQNEWWHFEQWVLITWKKLIDLKNGAQS